MSTEADATFDYSDIKPDDVPLFEMPTEEPEPDDEPLGWMGPNGDDGKELDVNASFMKRTPRPPKALKYEKKANGLVTDAIALTAKSPGTLPDSAALILTGEDLSKAIGDLANHDERIAKAMDWLSEGVMNPYLAVAMAATPLVIQLVRNHEPVFEPKPRKIGFRKLSIRIPFKFGIRLGLLRHRTADPAVLAASVFSDSRVMKRMRELGIEVATPQTGRR